MRLIVALLFIVLIDDVQGATYHFSNNAGNDSRSALQAQNPSTPWKSLIKLNSIFSILKAGDTILFKRNEVFNGFIDVTKSGNINSSIVFAAYGSGARPVISGFTSLTAWASVGKGVWESACSSNTMVNVVLVNNIFKDIGRYPNSNAANKGYLKYEGFSGNTQITDKRLATLNWKGGEVVIRKNRWVLDRNTITNQSGGTLSYTSESRHSASLNYGYFLQNHHQTLDLPGEWYYKISDKKLGIYFPSGSPSSANIQASIISTLVSIKSQANIVFDNISFKGANNNAFDITNSTNIRISSCDIVFSGANAINVNNTDNLSIEGLLIDHTNNIAINADNCSNAIIRNNKISNTGSVAGMGKGDSGSYEAIMIAGNNNLVELNQIEDVGYIGITYSGSSITIKNNFINNFAFIKDDGSGIYTSSPSPAGSKVIGNIVLNGQGAGEGTDNPAYLPANGIYMDDNATNTEISNNTIANCRHYGIFIHNAHEISLQKNTLFNNNIQLVMARDANAENSPIRNVSAGNNIFFSRERSQPVAEFKTPANDIASFGQFDSNYYCRPVDDNVVFNAAYIYNNTSVYKQLDLDSWKALFGKDKNSSKSPVTIPSYTVNNLIGANKFANGSFTTDVSGLYCYSSAGNCAVSRGSGHLDGGELKISFSKISAAINKASVIIGIGAITANKSYILKFSSFGIEKNMEIFLRKSLAPYNDLSARQLVKLPGTRSENEFLFTPGISDANASLVFDVEEQTTPLYLDNLQITEASVLLKDINESLRFEYNSSASVKNIALDGTYIDVKNNTYSASVNLDPFASVILLKQSSQTSSPAQCSASGSILREQWSNVDGNDLSGALFQTTPTSSGQLNLFEAPSNIADNYGARISGYICPPQTGNYTFWIAGDDATELWLSTDEKPANKGKIAYSKSFTNSREWDKFATQKSATVYLQAGRRYYIEALHKEGAGGDGVSVAWQLPNGTIEAPIPGNRLSPYSTTLPVELIGQTISFAPLKSQPLGVVPFVITATASSGLPVNFRIISGPATIAGNLITIVGEGKVTVEATQTGNQIFKAAPAVSQTFTVTPEVASCTGTGSILYELWENVNGNDLTNMSFQAPAGRTSQLTSFEAPSNFADNYGARIRGYICPPQSGNYTFFIAGDDAIELWLSTGETSGNKIRIAYSHSYTDSRQWNKFSSQQSAPVYLQSAKRYYIEALHKEGAGGDNLAVAWQLPGGTMEAPIPGNRLSNLQTTTNSQQKKSTKPIDKEVTGLKLKASPNPFKNLTTIQFVPFESGVATVEVYDLTGRMVRQLFKGAIEKGKAKQLPLYATGLADGVYIIKLVAKKNIVNLKVTVSK